MSHPTAIPAGATAATGAPATTQTNPNADISSVAQTPLTFEERSNMMTYLQTQRGMTEEQAAKFVDGFMQPDEVRQFLGIISGQQPLTREQMQTQWGLSESEMDFVLQGEESLSMSPASADRSNHFGGVFVTSHPFGNVFVEFMALMYSLGTDVKQMISKVIQQKKDMAIDAANEQFKGAIATFSASMVAGAISVGMASANLFRTKSKPAAGAETSPDAATKGLTEPTKPGGADNSNRAADAAARERRNSLLNESLNNTWTSPNAIGLLTQPIEAAGRFTDSYFQRESAIKQSEVQEAEAIFQQLMSHYQQTHEASQAAAQGAG